jgi:hypothetical protein
MVGLGPTKIRSFFPHDQPERGIAGVPHNLYSKENPLSVYFQFRFRIPLLQERVLSTRYELCVVHPTRDYQGLAGVGRKRAGMTGSPLGFVLLDLIQDPNKDDIPEHRVCKGRQQYRASVIHFTCQGCVLREVFKQPKTTIEPRSLHAG